MFLILFILMNFSCMSQKQNLFLVEDKLLPVCNMEEDLEEAMLETAESLSSTKNKLFLRNTTNLHKRQISMK